MTVTIEEKQRFSNSALWVAQREYYATEGIEAWASDVPFYVTSNPFIANSYANLIIRFIQDWVAQHPDALSEPFYILELGTGPGQFSYYLLKTLLAMQEKLGLKSLKIRYIMSDFTEKNIQFWKSNARLQRYVEPGILDFAQLDLEQSNSIYLHESKEALSADSLENPLIVVANYIFDTLKSDIFTVEKGELFESLVSLKTNKNNLKSGKPVDWEKVTVTHEASRIDHNYYDDKHCNAVLEDFKQGLTDSHFLFPVATLDAVKYLKTLSHGNMLVLCSDKGYATLEEQEELEYPELAFHGSFSVMVNFDAISRYFKKSGGDAMLQTQREGITSAVYASGIRFADFPETSLALEQYVEGFSPGDYFILHDFLCKPHKNSTLETLAALLSMSYWDPYVFDQVNERICELLDEDADPDTVEYLAANMQKIADNFYFIPEVEDCFCNVALFYHEAEKFQEAIPFYIQSLKYFGDAHVVLYNLGICHYEIDDQEKALDFFKRSLELDPKSKDARDWVKKLGER